MDDRQRRRVLEFSALTIVAAGLVTACGTTTVMSVPDTATARGYRVGMQLELRADRMLEQPTGTLNPAPPNLVREPLRAFPRRVTIEDYRRAPGDFPDIIGVVPAGTRLEVTRIDHRTYPGLEAWYEVRARILSGPYGGRAVALNHVSAHGPGLIPLVDPEEFAVRP